MGSNLDLRSLLSATSLPANEARILMAHVLDVHYQLPRTALLSRDDMILNADALEKWKTLESKRLLGEPIAYLISKKGFHNIELQVAPGVLIPRPETELLVDIALQEIKQKKYSAPKILDLGTGSGAIALAIAHEAPQALIFATDQSPEALKIAKANAKLLNLEKQVQFLLGDWYEALGNESGFDIILSNPPYITKQDPHLYQGDLRFEPLSALTDHADGLTCLKIIISGAKKRLVPRGLLALEHGYDQSELVCDLMKSTGFGDVKTHLDLAGHLRVASGISPNI